VSEPLGDGTFEHKPRGILRAPKCTEDDLGSISLVWKPWKLVRSMSLSFCHEITVLGHRDEYQV
jgi:hypothetical protein